MRRFTLAVITVMAFTQLRAENWPHWRGPAATGVSTETALPERWSDTENIAWKAPVRGLGISSPVVWGDRVFVTSQIGRGARRAGNHPTLVQGGNPADAGERALGGRRCGRPRQGRLSRHGTEPRRRPQAVGIRTAGRRASSPTCTTSTTSRRPARSPTGAACLRVVRHGPARGARHDGQARLVAASRPRVRAVRHQLGPQQLAALFNDSLDPHLLSRHRFVSAESRCRLRQDDMACRSRRQRSIPTARRWSSRPAARTS